MNNLFVPFEIAIWLKNLDFDEPCLTYYYDDGTMSDIMACDMQMKRFTNSKQGEWKPFGAAAPHYNQVLDYLRDKHKIYIDPARTTDTMGIWFYFYVVNHKKVLVAEGAFDYYPALNNAIRAALTTLPISIKK